TFLLVGSAVEHPSCSQPRCCLDDGMKDSQLQGDPVPPQFEGVVHILDHEFGMIEDLDDNSIGASAEFDRAWRWFDTGRVRKTLLAFISILFVANHDGGSRVGEEAP